MDNLLFGGLAAMSLLSALLPLLLFAPVVVYVVARWRTYREGPGPDPQLGWKTAIAFFKLLALQLALAGLYCLVDGVLRGEERGRGELLRLAVGLLVPAALVYGAHHAAGQRTNALEQPIAPRLFAGVGLMLTGLVAFGALVAGCVLLFQKHVGEGDLRQAWSLAVVYGVAWATQGVAFARGLPGAPPPLAVAQYAARPGPPPA